MKILPSVLLAMMLVVHAVAGGPKKIAKSNRSLWPYKINSVEEFDFASKMEMLVFARILHSYDELVIEDSIKRRLGVEKIFIPSIIIWKDNVRKILLANFGSLTQTSSHDFLGTQRVQNWEQIVAASNKQRQNLPENLKAWYTNASDFYDGYVYEQMRLASLFPRTTSEILTLQPSEINGTDYKDKQFLLTFDDGPSSVGGNTDKLISTLTSHHINGVFFVVGDVLQTRLKASSAQKLRALYSPMVVGSHGKVHKPHQKYDGWQSSLSFTDNLIDSVAGEEKPAKYFRPPYGQRNDKMIAYLADHHTRVMLWNIDSQDWNASITPREVADRVTTLMLLWRRGIILFHDIHPKANIALPVIWEGFKNAEVHWMDAKELE
jgi:peptidoglycan/xylan/chitin deacetylase (PgdA/CDA1 family)